MQDWLPQNLSDQLGAMESRRDEIEGRFARSEGGGALAAEYGKLLQPTDKFRALRALQKKIGELDEMADSDPDLAEMAGDERRTLADQCQALAEDLRRMMRPESADDERGCFLEIRAAVGGNESCLFAGALLRMYCRLAEARKWRAEIISRALGEVGGYKEVVIRINGRGAYGNLRREAGAHRVQRVPETESQGRIHTSVATVAVMPEASPEENAAISPADLRIETFRSSGAGGQHVNTTDSAVRVTHIPTGAVAECQDDRSQHKNRARALAVLQARIAQQKKRERLEREAGERRAMVGSGERSDRIRTYNFPQGRLTDHRIGLTLYKLPAVMEGELDEVIDALAAAESRGNLHAGD